MYKIRMGDGKRWNIDGDEECGHITLMEPGRSVNNTLVLLGQGYMRIITACSGYEYLIQDKEDGDGAEVTFSGPVNALLAQSLMPRMRYVPGTLRGMSEDMPDYADSRKTPRRRSQSSGCARLAGEHEVQQRTGAVFPAV